MAIFNCYVSSPEGKIKISVLMMAAISRRTVVALPQVSMQATDMKTKLNTQRSSWDLSGYPAW